MDLFIFARFHAREGREGAVAAALRDEVQAARAEAGCLAHQAYVSTRDSRLFFIHSRWVNEAAFEAHAELPHTVQFLEHVQPLIDHELDVSRTRPLGSQAVERGNHDTKYFAVTRERGPGWNESQPLREQAKWAEHAAFMNQLDEEGFVVFGGPVGNGEKLGFSKSVFLVNADSERTIKARLEADPWTQMRILQTRIEQWQILLGNEKLKSA